MHWFFVVKCAAKISRFLASDVSNKDLKFQAFKFLCDINSLEYKIPKMGIPERNETNLYASNNSILMQNLHCRWTWNIWKSDCNHKLWFITYAAYTRIVGPEFSGPVLITKWNWLNPKSKILRFDIWFTFGLPNAACSSWLALGSNTYQRSQNLKYLWRLLLLKSIDSNRARQAMVPTFLSQYFEWRNQHLGISQP